MARRTSDFNPHVIPVDYDIIVRWIQEDPPVFIPKLGRLVRNGRVCHFWCSVTEQGLIQVTENEDGTGDAHVYSRNEWNQICNNMRWTMGNGGNPEYTYWYTNDPNHRDVPQIPYRRWGPNVPAICRSYNEWILLHNHE